jgi:hypothetical protein
MGIFSTRDERGIGNWGLFFYVTARLVSRVEAILRVIQQPKRLLLMNILSGEVDGFRDFIT